MPQRKITLTEEECLAIIWALLKLRHYLEGYHFTITDHLLDNQNGVPDTLSREPINTEPEMLSQEINCSWRKNKVAQVYRT